MAILLQRLCWNSNSWRGPTGDRYRQEDSYVGRTGFGHEEWNFNTADLIGGHVHGYCYYNPPEGSPTLAGSHQIHFFAIEPNTHARMLVGRYCQARFLTKDEQEELKEELLHSDYGLKRIEELLALDIEPLSDEQVVKEHLFGEFALNLRVTPEHVKGLGTPVPLSPSDIGGRDPKHLSRYARPVFLSAPPSPARSNRVSRATPTIGGHDEDLLTDAYLRFTKAQRRVIKRNHNALSNRFRLWLKQTGAQGVSAEAASVDVVCMYSGETYLIELKSCYRSSTRHALREALGQLLEYSFFPGRPPADHICVVLDATPTSADLEWFRTINQKLFPVELFWLKGETVHSAGVTNSPLADRAVNGEGD